MKIHPSITTERVMDAVERQSTSLDNPGFCIACGEDAERTRQTPARYTCEACGAPAVYGAETLLLLLF